MEIEWLPFDLHPEIPPEGMALPSHVRNSFGGMSERLLEMAQDSGREMVIPEKIPSSRRALEATEYAREQDKHAEFHQIVFRKFYGEGQDMSDWAVLYAAAEEIGLNPGEMQAHTESGIYKPVVDKIHAEAVALGITGVPAYIFDNRYAIVGAQPYDVFQKLMARLSVEVHAD